VKKATSEADDDIFKRKDADNRSSYWWLEDISHFWWLNNTDSDYSCTIIVHNALVPSRAIMLTPRLEFHCFWVLNAQWNLSNPGFRPVLNLGFVGLKICRLPGAQKSGFGFSISNMMICLSVCLCMCMWLIVCMCLSVCVYGMCVSAVSDDGHPTHVSVQRRLECDGSQQLWVCYLLISTSNAWHCLVVVLAAFKGTVVTAMTC